MKVSKEHEQEIYLKHKDYISKIIEKLLKANETFRYLKEELEAECALEFIEALRRYEVLPDAKFTTYLYQVIQGRATDRIREEAKITQGEAAYAEEMVHIADESYELDRFEELLDAGNLTDNQKDVLRMRFVLGMTDREVADLTGVSHVAVHKTEKRALGSLKYALENLNNY